MNLNYVPAGPSTNKDDEIIFDITDGKSKSGFGQPSCGGKGKRRKIISSVRLSGPKIKAQAVE